MKQAKLCHAKCITSAQESASILLRKKFCAKNIVRASITVAGFGFFYGYLNGKKISEDMFQPLSTDYEKRDMVINGIPFDEELGHRIYCPVYDVTDLLQNGENILCFAVGGGWYPHRDWETARYGAIKLAYCLELTHCDGSLSYVVSDEQDKVCPGFMTAGDILTGETLDFTDHDDTWLTSNDDSKWDAATTVPLPETNYYIQECPADRVMRRIAPKLLWEKDGVSLYDAGEVFTGYPEITLTEGFCGDIRIRYGELLQDGGLKKENIHGQHTNIKTDGKARTVDTHFTWYCFRYFEVTGPCQVGDCLVIHTDIATTSSFHSDNAVLNWIYGAFLRTQLANMHCGIPSDCPHIERKGYTGDGHLTCKPAMQFLDAKKFYRKWIYDIADCQDKITGHVQYTAPYLNAGGGPGGWGGAVVLVPYYYYLQYGDTEILSELYPHMLRYFDYMEAHSEQELVTSDRPKGWCLGEWCTPDQLTLDDRDGVKIPQPFVNTYFYIKTMEIAVQIAKILHIEETPQLQGRIQRKKEAMMQAYFDEASGDFCQNLQGANAFAVDIGMGDGRTFQNMVTHYTTLGRYDTGIFGTELVTRLLFEKGYPKIALALLISNADISFRHHMEAGATTLFENWHGVRSRCHPMFGAVSAYLTQYILGIRATEAAYRTIVIDPQCMDEIKEASGHITTEQGVIAVRYNSQNLWVTVPQNMQVEILTEDRKVILERREQA